METNFGNSTPYSLGIEEEHQILDGATLELQPGIEALLASFDGDAVRPRVKPELHQSVVEISTRVAATVPEAVRDVADLRDRLRRAAAEQGSLIASSGTHPTSPGEHQEVTERRRYTDVAKSLGGPVARQLVFGLHVHVGISSAEKAIHCANGMRRHLPELLALSANSPFWEGQHTGLASTRAQLAGGMPRSGVPPAFSSFGEYSELVESGVESGCFPDYTYLWWDVRPHPALGTIEVRVCDAQTRMENVAALTALVQSLVATLGIQFECGEPVASDPQLLLEENRWRAARDGLQAELVDLDGGPEKPVSESIRELVARCRPAAEALGCAWELEGVEDILRRGTGADDQERAYEDGDLTDVVRWLVEETALHAVGLS